MVLRGQRKYSERNVVHHKAHMDYPAMEPGSLRWKAGVELPKTFTQFMESYKDSVST